MKNSYGITVGTATLAADLTRIIDALEPADLAQIEAEARRAERNARGLYGLLAVFSQVLSPKQAGAAPPDGVQARLAELEDLANRTADEVAKLHALVLAMADRIAAQSELLGQRAGGDKAEVRVEVPAAIAERMVDLARAEAGRVEAQPGDVVAVAVSSTVIPAAEPSVNGAKPPTRSAAAGHEKRLRVARLLAAEGPLSVKAIAERTGIPPNMVSYFLPGHEWFEKVPPANLKSPYRLTTAGKKALGESGTPAPEPSPPADAAPAAESEAPGPIPETPAATRPPEPTGPRPELSPADRDREQCRLMCEAIVEQGRPLDSAELTRETGLPLEVCEKRLRKHGPDAAPTVPRYFARSARDPGRWLLTNSGDALARGEGKVGGG